MAQHLSSHRSSSFMERAKETIFSQCGTSAGVRRSAWWLFRHQLTQTDPETGKCYTPRKALRNALCWMASQAEMLKRIEQEPTASQRRLLQMLVDGKTEKEIACELGKYVPTIHINIRRLKDRLGIRSLYRLVAVAAKKGWVVVDGCSKARTS